MKLHKDPRVTIDVMFLLNNSIDCFQLWQKEQDKSTKPICV